MLSSFITWDVSPPIIGFNIVDRMFRREGAPESWVGILLIYVAVATIVGARLGHVFFYQWDYYSAHPWKILATWEGGLASHGGAIGIIIAILLYSRFVTHGSPLVGSLIRFGNLMNSEIFGHATTLPWGFYFVRSAEWQTQYFGQACHPTQIYEALCYFALFALLMWMYWKKNAEERPGLLFGVFFIGIFLPRFLIEFIKNDQTAFEAEMTLNMGQWHSIPFIITGIILVIWSLTRPKVHIEFPDRYADEPTDKRRK